MPKTNKKFDWEVYDENGEFIDILTMSRSEAKDYKKKFSDYTIKEIEMVDDGRDNSWRTSG